MIKKNKSESNADTSVSFELCAVDIEFIFCSTANFAWICTQPSSQYASFHITSFDRSIGILYVHARSPICMTSYVGRKYWMRAANQKPNVFMPLLLRTLLICFNIHFADFYSADDEVFLFVFTFMRMRVFFFRFQFSLHFLYLLLPKCLLLLSLDWKHTEPFAFPNWMPIFLLGVCMYSCVYVYLALHVSIYFYVCVLPCTRSVVRSFDSCPYTQRPFYGFSLRTPNAVWQCWWELFISQK